MLDEQFAARYAGVLAREWRYVGQVQTARPQLATEAIRAVVRLPLPSLSNNGRG
jgi:hypothetical protein